LFLPSIIGGDVARLAVEYHEARVRLRSLREMWPTVFSMWPRSSRWFRSAYSASGSLPAALQAPARNVLVAGAAVAVLVLSVVLILHRPLLRGRSIRFRRRLAQIRHAIRSISRHPHRLVFGWLLGTSVQGTYILLTALVGISCGLVLPLRVWLFAWPLAKMAAVMPITQGESESAKQRWCYCSRRLARRPRECWPRESSGKASSSRAAFWRIDGPALAPRGDGFVSTVAFHNEAVPGWRSREKVCQSGQ